MDGISVNLALLSIIFLCPLQAYKPYLAERIQNWGYRFTTHENIATEDGYLLTLYRVNKNSSTFKGVTYLVHGLIVSGDSWFLNKRKNVLPLLLADEGYDVWIANLRGTFASLKHNVFNASDTYSPYWNYSFHEMGLYDVPATIDFILNATECEKLIYIGDSQGTTVFFALMSLLPEYSNKIAMMVALAPTVFFKHSSCLFIPLSDFFKKFSLNSNDGVTYGIANTEIGEWMADTCTGRFRIICE